MLAQYPRATVTASPMAAKGGDMVPAQPCALPPPGWGRGREPVMGLRPDNNTAAVTLALVSSTEIGHLGFVVLWTCRTRSTAP